MTINTFEKYSKDIAGFIASIINSNPDYIVPVEKKGCKLLRAFSPLSGSTSQKLYYMQFFQNTKVQLKGKKIAVIDDASKFTSSLYEFREFFEDQGAIVLSYSFVGHELLITGERPQYDIEAQIHQHLNESTYQEYIIQQSMFLSLQDNHFDIDHFVVRCKPQDGQIDSMLNILDNLVHCVN